MGPFVGLAHSQRQRGRADETEQRAGEHLHPPVICGGLRLRQLVGFGFFRQGQRELSGCIIRALQPEAVGDQLRLREPELPHLLLQPLNHFRDFFFLLLGGLGALFSLGGGGLGLFANFGAGLDESFLLVRGGFVLFLLLRRGLGYFGALLLLGGSGLRDLIDCFPLLRRGLGDSLHLIGGGLGLFADAEQTAGNVVEVGQRIGEDRFYAGDEVACSHGRPSIIYR